MTSLKYRRWLSPRYQVLDGVGCDTKTGNARYANVVVVTDLLLGLVEGVRIGGHNDGHAKLQDTVSFTIDQRVKIAQEC